MQRFERLRVADTRQRAGDRRPRARDRAAPRTSAGVARRSPMRPSATAAACRVSRSSARSCSISRATTPAPFRTSASTTCARTVRVAEQARQRALDSLAFSHPSTLASPQPIGTDALDGIQKVLRAGGRDDATDQSGDVLAGAVAALVPIVEAGQRVGDHLGRRRRTCSAARPAAGTRPRRRARRAPRSPARAAARPSAAAPDAARAPRSPSRPTPGSPETPGRSPALRDRRSRCSAASSRSAGRALR